MSDAGNGEVSCPQQLRDKRLRVGCALLPKKVSRYLTPSMLATAARNNVELVQIDYTKPLAPQGPFSAIIHKLRPNQEWEHMLHDYIREHPWVRVIDRLDRIRTLQNRATMLSPLMGPGILIQRPAFDADGTPVASPAKRLKAAQVMAPLQIEIAEGTTAEEAAARLAAAGLTPPLLCKPLWTDGREGSHGLAVLHDLEALQQLLDGEVSSEFRPPLVVQQYVEHGGVLFKVYVLGTQTVVTPRPSLGETDLEAEEGVQQLPRISCVSHYAKAAAAAGGSSGGASGLQQSGRPGQGPEQQQQQRGQGPAEGSPPPCGNLAAAAAAEGASPSSCREHVLGSPPPAAVGFSSPGSSVTASPCPSMPWSPPQSPASQPPPEWVTSALSRSLRRRLGMQLFNFDLICPEGQESADRALYYVVDINYFPGVDKIPGFEQKFVEFLRSACERDLTRGSSCSGCSSSASGYPSGSLTAALPGTRSSDGAGVGPGATAGDALPANGRSRGSSPPGVHSLIYQPAALQQQQQPPSREHLVVHQQQQPAGEQLPQQQQSSGLCVPEQQFSHQLTVQQQPQPQQQQQQPQPAAPPRLEKSTSSSSMRAVAAGVGSHVLGSSPVQQQQQPALQMAECS